ncbi:hypothetical protein X805_29180 [Sphaerotilus natans subsp. natans DSM 6575]|uniref:Uncharacterized protein n=1 Tax=Sphaerotilus natans subsp. natans DSM 6575 TaxID=1286631 RepID=A0A059KJL6_9BURK|nr:hypothetical protein X805_29180 [Sphaerotilus natans subsp. natans DSM 6575]
MRLAVAHRQAVQLDGALRLQQPHQIAQDGRVDHLPRHQHRDARRIGHDLVAADPIEQRRVGQAALVEQGQALAGLVEGVARQAGQPGEVRDARQPRHRAGLAALLLGLARQPQHRVEQPRDLAAGRADGQQQRQRAVGVLLDLDVEALDQLVAQLVGAPARGRDVDRQLGRVESDAVAPHLVGQQFVQAQHPEHAGGIDLLAQLGGEAQRALEQAVALHHRLPARHIQAGDQAVLRAGRGVHVEVLPEQVLVEAGVVHMDHAGLREGREHLVRALGDIVGAGLQRGRAQRGMEARVPVPGLVDDHLDAGGVGGRDDRRQVVAQAVVGAARQDQHPGLRMVLDRLQHPRARHRPEQAVALVDRGVQVHRPRARQDHAVVHRLVAVAVEQQRVARRQQRLEDDLVRGRGAVGGEIGAPRAEGLRGQALRLRDHAGRMQQRIELRHRHREIGAQHLLADEVVEVAHPRAGAVGVAAGVARRVPGILGLRDIGAQRVIEGRGRGLGHLGGEDAHPAGRVGVATEEVAVDALAGQRLDQAAGVVVVEQQVDRQLRAALRQGLRQRDRLVAGGDVDQHQLHRRVGTHRRQRLPGRGALHRQRRARRGAARLGRQRRDQRGAAGLVMADDKKMDDGIGA